MGVSALKATSKKNKSRGISLHIGVNKLNPECYPYIDEDTGEKLEWDGKLNACETDARDMQNIADSQGFESTILLTKKATTKNVIKEMRRIAKELSAGDSFLLTYSGHGGTVRDRNRDEKDTSDETWCLYDRQFIDDELFALYTEFKAGVQILVLSDSCHSGTVTRGGPPKRKEPTSTESQIGIAKPVYRMMPRETSSAIYRARRDFYDEIQKATKRPDPKDIKASIRLISACQDDELAAEEEYNGKFTDVLMRIWDDGKFEGNCKQFHAAIRKYIENEHATAVEVAKKAQIEEPSLQRPNYCAEGPKKDKTMDKRRPFSI